MPDGYAKIDLGDGRRLSGVWDRMSALEIYNQLLVGSRRGHEWSTTERRLQALIVFKKRFTLRLPDLAKELRQLWPHWDCGRPGTLDVEACCRQIERVFDHLETGGKPFALDAWRPTTRRGRNVVADADRVGRRFLDNRVFGKTPTTGSGLRGRPKKQPLACRIHADRRAVSGSMCSQCYSRYLRLTAAGIVGRDCGQDVLDAIFRLPAVRGPHSTFMADVAGLLGGNTPARPAQSVARLRNPAAEQAAVNLAVLAQIFKSKRRK